MAEEKKPTAAERRYAKEKPSEREEKPGQEGAREKPREEPRKPEPRREEPARNRVANLARCTPGMPANARPLSTSVKTGTTSARARCTPGMPANARCWPSITKRSAATFTGSIAKSTAGCGRSTRPK